MAGKATKEKKEVVQFLCEKTLKDAFKHACEKIDMVPAQVHRQLMREFLEKQEPQQSFLK